MKVKHLTLIKSIKTVFLHLCMLQLEKLECTLAFCCPAHMYGTPEKLAAFLELEGWIYEKGEWGG